MVGMMGTRKGGEGERTGDAEADGVLEDQEDGGRHAEGPAGDDDDAVDLQAELRAAAVEGAALERGEPETKSLAKRPVSRPPTTPPMPCTPKASRASS